jgi:hypothetical protein
MTTAPMVFLFGDCNQAESRVVAWKGPVPKLKQWYQEGVDVHSYVANEIADYIKKHKIKLPGGMFSNPPYGKGTEEREKSKRTVHAANYGMEADKYATIVGLQLEIAKRLYKIYFDLFPEIKTNYQSGVENILKTTRTIWVEHPFPFRKIFWGEINATTFRSAYSCYPQCLVGSIVDNAIRQCRAIFFEDKNEDLKEHWCEYYGEDNWDEWRRLRDSDDHNPERFKWRGIDIPLNVHDAGGIRVPDKPDLVRWCAIEWKRRTEIPLTITPFNKAYGVETMVIPVDFKKGANWGVGEDYKV